MKKLIAILVASMFASGSVFAASHMKGEEKKKDEKMEKKADKKMEKKADKKVEKKADKKMEKKVEKK